LRGALRVTYTGELTCQATKAKETFQVRRLKIEDLSAILNVQQVVLDTLEKKDTLQPLSDEEFRTILDGNGLMLGVFVRNHLVAFRALWFPREDKENLGRDLGLSVDEQMNVVHQEITSVHPDYRGNGLQKRLAFLVMKELENMNGSYHYVCCTVHPFNLPSLKDKLSQGLLIAKVKEKYAGHLRYIFMREFQREMRLDNDGAKLIALEDLEGQKRLLEQGYYGYQLFQKEGQLMVGFAKPIL
jgi:ribosomal protein S18 acetylase RimI-like enzyme